MMADTLRMAVAVVGNAASVALYAAPIVTFKRVIRKKSTEEFSCVPYIIGLLNCLLLTWYGMPVVSNKWENFLLVIGNGVGIVLELSYVLIYFWYASPKRKVSVARTAIPVMLVFCITAAVSVFAFHDHRHRKLLVRIIGHVVEASMYGYLVIVMMKVIETKSVKYMPLLVSICSFLASVLWLTYGVLIRDIFIMGANSVGTLLALLQLILHCKYDGKTRVAEEPNIEDLEKGEKENVNLEMNDEKQSNGNS